ncbi:MAG: hypothetical protein HY934_04480 [Candidatus Firestonebacteria bacterium]|nr:hypothetical protein [Candidatus Firestonebacteria bacterium]
MKKKILNILFFPFIIIFSLLHTLMASEIIDNDAKILNIEAADTENIDYYDSTSQNSTLKKDIPFIRSKPLLTDTKKTLLQEVGEFPDFAIKVYHEEKGLFSFKYPREWIIEKDDENKKIIYLKYPENKAEIMIYTSIAYDEDIQQILEKRHQLLNERFPILIEYSTQEKLNISGKDMISIKYKGFVTSNQPMLGELIALIDINENYYVFALLLTDKESFEIFRKINLSLLRSFKITRSIKADTDTMNILIGTWYASENAEKTITFHGNVRFIQNKFDLYSSFSNLGLDFNWEIENPEKNKLSNNGKFKVIGDTLYLFYENGTSAEFALNTNETNYIRIDQKIFKKKLQ